MQIIFRLKNFIFFVPFCLSICSYGQEYTIAREWNEALLESIRNDFARPVVHARNLFHVSAAMYDAWAIHNNEGSP